MEDFEELEFVIPAYTRDTMPLDRLLQYLQQIGELLAVPEAMHLVAIEESSTKPVFRMSSAAATSARDHAHEVRRGGGTRSQRAAFARIRQMVKLDGGKPASLTDRTGILLDFPPAPEEIGAIAGVRQAGSFDGSLLRVGGVGEFANILMRDLGGDVFSGFSAPKELAKAMAKLLYEPIRVTGIGSWDRTSAGTWAMSKMLIQTYEPLVDESLDDVFRKLRAAPVVWPTNVDELMRTERELVP